METRPLTSQQQRVYDFLVEFFEEHGFAPSLRETGEALGLANVNAVRGHVSALEKKGYITREADKARSIRIVGTPSPMSRLKRQLHEALRTDEGVLHRIVYGMAWTTWRRTPHFTGERLTWINDAIDREVVERGWTLLDRRIEPDYVVLVVAAWPNHSPEQTVRRFRSAGISMWWRHPGKFVGSRLWDKGYVVTTELDLLDEMVKRMLEETEQDKGRRDGEG